MTLKYALADVLVLGDRSLHISLDTLTCLTKYKDLLDWLVPIDETLESYFDIQPLSVRRRCCDLQFLFKLVNGLIECTSLLNKIEFSVYRGTKSKSLFVRGFQARNYPFNHGESRLQRASREASVYIDFFGLSPSCFKRDALRYLTRDLPRYSSCLLEWNIDEQCLFRWCL